MLLLLFFAAGDAGKAAALAHAAKIAEASQSPPDLDALLCDMLDELALDLRKQDLQVLSPVALETPAVSPNLAREAKERLAFMASQRLRKIEGFEEAYCIGCDSGAAARREGDAVVFSAGDVDREAAAARARRLGAKTFLRLGLEALGPKLSLSVAFVSAHSGAVLFSKRYLSDAARTLLQREPDAMQTALERQREIAAQTKRLSAFGHALFLGMVRIPFSLDKQPAGSISGLSFAYRIYEVFGDNRQFLLGVQLQGFIEPQSSLPVKLPIPVSGGFVQAVGAYTLKFDDLRLPLFRLGAQAGGYFGGSLGNNFAAGGLFEVMMRFRLGFNFALMYVVPSDVSQQLKLPLTVGGLSWVVGTSFNWD